jgi:hypothetical protein
MKWQFTTVAACYKTSRQEHFSVFTTSDAVETFWVIQILKTKQFRGGGEEETVPRAPCPAALSEFLTPENWCT